MSAHENLFEESELKIDLSPMIDLVFLLLIFFLVASTLITYKKDPNVIIPIASDGKVPKVTDGRVIINIYRDGTIVSENGDRLTIAEVEQRMSQAKAGNPNTRLHLRADQGVPYRHIKEVSQASAKGGVPTIIFSTYQTSKGS